MQEKKKPERAREKNGQRNSVWRRKQWRPCHEVLEEEQKDNRDKKSWSHDQLEEKSKPGDKKVLPLFIYSFDLLLVVWSLPSEVKNLQQRSKPMTVIQAKVPMKVK